LGGEMSTGEGVGVAGAGATTRVVRPLLSAKEPFDE
jgi:hypothetical protein